MTKENHRFPCFFIWMALLCLALFIFPVSAQNEDHYRYEPITKVDLGVNSLELEKGESYTFHVTFEPENTILKTLDWYVTDERVISIDPLTNTVTALSDGEARIFAESFDEVSYAVCNVKVGTSEAKDASVMKSGADLIGLSRGDIRKITAPTLVHYLDFAADSTLDEEAFDGIAGRFYDVLAVVRPGSEEAESRKAVGLGLGSEPLRNLQAVTLRGTVKQLLAFIRDNSDLIEIIELGNTWFDEPVSDPDEEELISKTVQNRFNLKAAADELSSFTKAHDLGLTGEGRIIAIIDTGFVSSHEQFMDRNGKGRFIHEACFSITERINRKDYYSACTDGVIDDGNGASLDLNKIIRKHRFNHGTHVAGIAAGRDGVAPDVKIIGIQAASEVRWNCSGEEKETYSCSQNSNQCCTPRFVNSNVARAYDYLLELSKELAKSGKKIDAVNMSFGGPKSDGKGFKTFCDSVYPFYKNYFNKLIAAGMLPVVAAGNESFTDSVGQPACISNGFTVAALTNYKEPFLASYSNFDKTNTDIAAPGHRTYASDAISIDRKTMKITCTKDCYGYMDGTSSAAPMVSGAAALVKQLYPGMLPGEVEKFLLDISGKTVSKRVTYDSKWINFKFDFSKPVLDLSDIPGWFQISDSMVKAQKGRVSVSFADPTIQEHYQIKVYDVGGKKWMNDIKYTSTSENDGIRKLDISGDFKEGKLYCLEIRRWFGNDSSEKTLEKKYFYPLPLPKTLTAGIQNNGVTLNMHLASNEKKNQVIYRVYSDWTTNKVVKTVYAGEKKLAQTVSGLVNGQKYYVTAQFYRDIKVNNRSQRFYGMETDPVGFVPLNDSFVCKTAADKTGVTINCPKDPAATGIRVLYRTLDNTFTVKDGCTSAAGTFSCKIMDASLLQGGAQQFIIMKYKLDVKGQIWNSSSTVLTRLGKNVLIPRPEKPLIYFTENKDNVTVSMAGLGSSKGIVVLAQDNDEEFVPFCNANQRACTGNGKERSYLVMRYKKDGDNIYFSPGVYTIHNYGQI